MTKQSSIPQQLRFSSHFIAAFVHDDMLMMSNGEMIQQACINCDISIQHTTRLLDCGCRSHVGSSKIDAG